MPSTGEMMTFYPLLLSMACSVCCFSPLSGEESGQACGGPELSESSDPRQEENMVVSPVNITGRVSSHDGSGDLDQFIFFLSRKSNLEFFKVVRPFVPITGKSVEARGPGRVRWFFKAWDEPLISHDMEEDAPYPIDLEQLDREHGLGFHVERMPEHDDQEEEAGAKESMEAAAPVARDGEKIPAEKAG